MCHVVDQGDVTGQDADDQGDATGEMRCADDQGDVTGETVPHALTLYFSYPHEGTKDTHLELHQYVYFNIGCPT